MGYENVKLWFAKDQDGNIVTIDEVGDIHNTYNCPVCGSSLLPKATESFKVTPHFAHVDASKCNNESQIHWWLKNALIEPGDEFKVASDKERKYICKEILVEQPSPTSFGEYRPDVTVITENGETIYFEMAFSNKKKIEDYLDLWLELKNIVVEVDIKQMMKLDSLPSFKALFFEGKCFNTKKNDAYYNTIGKYKVQLIRDKTNSDIEKRVKMLDWFWHDVNKYNNGQLSDDYMINLIESFENDERAIIDEILKKTVCSKLNTVYKDYLQMDYIHSYDEPVSPNSPLKKAIKKLNREYKKLNSEYSVSIERESNKHKANRWFKGRKQVYWVTNSYDYTVYFNYDISDNVYVHLPVTNQVARMNDEEEICSYFKEKFKQQDISRKCKLCSSRFTLNTREISFFINRKLNLPKKCLSCRKKS